MLRTSSIVLVGKSGREHIVAKGTFLENRYVNGQTVPHNAYSVHKELGQALAEHKSRWGQVNTCTNDKHVRAWLNLFLSQPVLPASSVAAQACPELTFQLAASSKAVLEALCSPLRTTAVSIASMPPTAGCSNPCAADGSKHARPGGQIHPPPGQPLTTFFQDACHVSHKKNISSSACRYG